MAGDFANEAVREFCLILDELDGNLGFLRLSSKLRPRLNGLLNWSAVQGDAKLLVTDFLKQKSVELGAQYRGMLVVLSGAFEQFVRRVVQDAVQTINTSAKGFDSLPENLKMQNVYRSGRALSTVREPLDHIIVDYQSLARSLATCVPGAREFTLNAEAFSLFISSVTPTHLADICRWIGITLEWDDFGRVNEFEVMLGTKGARATGKAVSEELARFIKLRNRIAHAGTGGVAVTDNDVDGFLRFFRVFASKLASVVGDKL
jgi:HEPN superfamily RiboL-PSP-like protein